MELRPILESPRGRVVVALGGVVAAVVLVTALFVGLVGLSFWRSDDQIAPPIDPSEALKIGNRQARNGELEEALRTYLEGDAAAAPSAVLRYNLGVVHQRLGRLPEAILWYRRAAESGAAGDPWLQGNLATARRTLGVTPRPPGGWVGVVLNHGEALRWTAIVLAWVAALLLWIDLLWRGAPWRDVTRRTRLVAWSAVALTAVLLYAAAWAASRGPRPAVLLEDCGGLAAGTEVWAVEGDGGWNVAGIEVDCGEGSLGWVEDQRSTTPLVGE